MRISDLNDETECTAKRDMKRAVEREEVEREREEREGDYEEEVFVGVARSIGFRWIWG